MAKLFHFSVVTSAYTAFEGDVSYVNLPTSYGSLGVMAGHAPMLCAVAKGTLRCTDENGAPLRIAVSDGVASVADGEMTVLVSEASVEE